LQENEYFFYSDLNLSALFAFGSGTKLTITENMYSIWDWKCETDIDIDKITLEGLYALNDAFKQRLFSNDDTLTIIENEILTLTSGYTIKNNASTGGEAFVIHDNLFTDIGTTVKLQYKAETESTYTDLVDKSSIIGGNWSCRSVLDINCGPELEQLLTGNQKVYYTTEDDFTDFLEDGDVLKFNILMQRGGGENINLGYITILNLDDEVYPTLLSAVKSDDNKIVLTSDGMYTPDFEDVDYAKFYAVATDAATPYMMIFVQGVVEGSEPTLQAYTSAGETSGDPIMLENGVNICQLVAESVSY